MTAYILRRLLYGAAVLVGVNLLTFILFFAVNTPDDMARLAIGGQRVNAQAVEKWKVERGYDKPLFYNASQSGPQALTDTIFYQRSVPLLTFDFGVLTFLKSMDLGLKKFRTQSLKSIRCRAQRSSLMSFVKLHRLLLSVTPSRSLQARL